MVTSGDNDSVSHRDHSAPPPSPQCNKLTEVGLSQQLQTAEEPNRSDRDSLSEADIRTFGAETNKKKRKKKKQQRRVLFSVLINIHGDLIFCSRLSLSR